MAGYFGTETQQRLQACAEASADFIATTPGACQVGRMMGSDDVDRLGWERIDAFLERDGVFGFRLIATEKIDDLRRALARRGYRFDCWNVFVADRASAETASRRLMQKLPDGLTELDMPKDAEGGDVRRIQALMNSTGIVPFSGSMLSGGAGQTTTVALGDEQGNVVAAAHGYLPHNAHSRYHRYA
ncbi:hypothetical protein LXM94_21885 [Rhizobium sp. TRM95111]|uniref:hypothetical protein n=1 Tax=Rhizobium alarense TaxID=2846851 RepID=UPI001F2CE0DD|nr:hypothetical protein [Rhizobium alarense]MCF3642626.1 hypothetical protein [Rhizobium alarense]